MKGGIFLHENINTQENAVVSRLIEKALKISEEDAEKVLIFISGMEAVKNRVKKPA